MNHFRSGSTRIKKTQVNSPNWTLRSNLKEQTYRKKHQQIILIQTRGSRHQSEKEKSEA